MAMAALDMPILNWFLNVIPESFLWYHLFLVLVFGYGLGYDWVGNDPVRNRDIIKMGIFGKIQVFIFLTGGWLKGVITIILAGAGAVDLVFAILFFRILITL